MKITNFGIIVYYLQTSSLYFTNLAYILHIYIQMIDFLFFFFMKLKFGSELENFYPKFFIGKISAKFLLFLSQNILWAKRFSRASNNPNEKLNDIIIRAAFSCFRSPFIRGEPRIAIYLSTYAQIRSIKKEKKIAHAHAE